MRPSLTRTVAVIRALDQCVEGGDVSPHLSTGRSRPFRDGHDPERANFDLPRSGVAGKRYGAMSNGNPYLPPSLAFSM